MKPKTKPKSKALEKAKPIPPGRKVQRDPDALNDQEMTFLLEYEANGHNGTRAYLAAYPLCSSHGAAAASACRLLRTAKISKVVEAKRKARWTALEMQADEAAALVSLSARADIGQAYDPETGVLLPVWSWPDSLRQAVKGVKPGAFGDTIQLHDQLDARKTILQMAGRLKNTVDLNHRFDHVAYLEGNDTPPDK